MSPIKTLRTRTAIGAALLALLALSVPLQAGALIDQPGKPKASTGSVSGVRGKAGVLNGTVNPHGLETTYYFQYGPTVAYGSVTPTTSVGSGVTLVKVGQTVNELMLGYHYRIVATNAAGTTLGKDRTFTTKKTTSKVEFPKEEHVVVYGNSFVLTGRLTGLNAGNRRVVLQSSTYPYLTPFATISAPATTNSLGVFSFRVSNLLASAQLRVGTLDPRPLYSSVITEHVAVRVSFHVRSSGHPGLVRLYGTVTPALSGAHVRFQVAKPVRPGHGERDIRFSTQFTTSVKHATKSFSRFSMVVTVRRTGNYRALVEPRPGALADGSSAHLLLHAAPGAERKKKG